MTLAHRLRRLFHRPPTIADCLRAASSAPCEPLRAPDPHKGVVGGPLLVERTRANRDAHLAPYRDDAGFPDIEWGRFSVEALGHDLPEDAA